MFKITLELVRDEWEACVRYPTERLALLYDRPCTPLEVLERADGEWATVPVEDRFWTVLRQGVLPDSLMRRFACWCAREALMGERAAGREPHADSWRAIEVSERFAEGQATAEELAAARDAVRDAAWAAASVAARDAARAAAWDAARDAAWDAAWAAARDAARAAARDAARDAAWDAVRDAAWAAVRDAAWDAASDAAWAAARDAASAAAWAAAWAAARDAARDAQLKQLIAMVRAEEELTHE